MIWAHFCPLVNQNLTTQMSFLFHKSERVGRKIVRYFHNKSKSRLCHHKNFLAVIYKTGLDDQSNQQSFAFPFLRRLKIKSVQIFENKTSAKLVRNNLGSNGFNPILGTLSIVEPSQTWAYPVKWNLKHLDKKHNKTWKILVRFLARKSHDMYEVVSSLQEIQEIISSSYKYYL